MYNSVNKTTEESLNKGKGVTWFTAGIHENVYLQSITYFKGVSQKGNDYERADVTFQDKDGVKSITTSRLPFKFWADNKDKDGNLISEETQLNKYKKSWQNLLVDAIGHDGTLESINKAEEKYGTQIAKATDFESFINAISKIARLYNPKTAPFRAIIIDKKDKTSDKYLTSIPLEWTRFTESMLITPSTLTLDPKYIRPVSASIDKSKAEDPKKAEQDKMPF